jgi:hypothetical protein
MRLDGCEEPFGGPRLETLMQPLRSMKGESVNKALHALTLTTTLILAGFTAAGAEYAQQQPYTSNAAAYTSTCWLTCFSLATGRTNYKAFNVTQAECCSGAALSCPSGSAPAHPSWGEPAVTCPINEM